MGKNYNRGGMGNLDASEAEKYAEDKKGKESEEEIDKDIEGQRKKQSIFRTKNYEDNNKDIKEDYKKMSESNELIERIPSRYKEHR